MAQQKHVGPGDESTGGLPKRLNKAQRREEQAAAARAERIELDSFSVPDRPGRPKGDDGYASTR